MHKNKGLNTIIYRVRCDHSLSNADCGLEASGKSAATPRHYTPEYHTEKGTEYRNRVQNERKVNMAQKNKNKLNLKL